MRIVFSKTAATLFMLLIFGTGSICADDPKPEPERKQDQAEAEKEEPQRPRVERPGSRRRQGRQETSRNSRMHASVRAVFEEVVDEAVDSTVRILVDGKQVALGTVVSPNGHVLTKASELQGDAECEFTDGRKLSATVVGLHPDSDLALLKVDAEDLKPIRWDDELSPPVGSFLATPGLDEHPISIGVVSVGPRPIRPASGVLGVMIEDDKRGARIDKVFPDSAAEKAGLRVNDVIMRVNGHEIAGRQKLIERVSKLRPGTHVRLAVLRDETTMTITATLGDRRQLDPQSQRGEFQNQLGGNLSSRRQGFASVLQHDTVLRPNQCGGPVVDLDGAAVGINIARAGRVESYALPVKLLNPLITDMIAGKLSPAVAAGQRLEELKDAVSALVASEKDLSEKLQQLKTVLADRHKVLAKLEKSEKSPADKIAAAKAEVEKSQAAVKELETELAVAKTEREAIAQEMAALQGVSQSQTTGR